MRAYGEIIYNTVAHTRAPSVLVRLRYKQMHMWLCMPLILAQGFLSPCKEQDISVWDTFVSGFFKFCFLSSASMLLLCGHKRNKARFGIWQSPKGVFSLH